MPCLKTPGPNIDVYRFQSINITRMAVRGAARNNVFIACVTKILSFVKSFIASANGCGVPIYPTLFGPFRVWIYDRIFRSSRVKKPTVSAKHSSMTVIFIIYICTSPID